MRKYLLTKKAQKILLEAQHKEDALNSYCIFQREEFNEMERKEIKQMRNHAHELLMICDNMSSFSISLPSFDHSRTFSKGFSPSALDI